jgi:hypothetical protein
MAWISDFEARRTYDPETGLELFVVGGGPGHAVFEIRGEGYCLEFSAFKNEDPMTAKECSRFNVERGWGSVYCVFNRYSDQQRELISSSLLAFKGGNGFSLSDREKFFVRFERDGKLYCE